MLFVFVDECNPEPDTSADQNRFLVFGALIVESKVALELTSRVEKIRWKYGFLPSDSLKYAVSDKPAQVSRDDHTAAKKEVLETAANLGVKCFVYFALHKIIDRNGQDTYLGWALDAILTKAQQFYTEEKSSDGFMVFIDRHSRSSQASHMAQKFRERKQQPNAAFNTPDLIGVNLVWDGTSHLASVCDIVTGSLSYVINNPTRDIAGKSLIKLVRPMVWGRPVGGELSVVGRGLLFRPENQRSEKFRRLYEETKMRIIQWANEK